MNFDTDVSDDRRFYHSSDILKYMYAGKGVFTLMAPFGVHHSYLFSKPKETDAFPDDVVFVYAIHKDDNVPYDKLFYIGMLSQGKFSLTRKSRFAADTDIVRGAQYIVKMAYSEALTAKTPMILYHNGHCAKCGRILSDEKTMKIGIGRKCLPRCGVPTIAYSIN